VPQPSTLLSVIFFRVILLLPAMIVDAFGPRAGLALCFFRVLQILLKTHSSLPSPNKLSVSSHLAYTSRNLSSHSFSFRQKLLAFAAIANGAIIVAWYATLGLNEPGGGAATRFTARFAIVFFLIGFAAPGLRKWLAGFPDGSLWMQAFVIAQFVHFAAVIFLHAAFVEHGLHLGIGEVAIVLAGFTAVAGIGLTASPLPGRRIRSAIHIFLIYVILLILAADYFQHPIKPLRWMLLPIVLAFLLRHLPRRSPIQNVGEQSDESSRAPLATKSART
jgi:hypothetical protein